jgi:6-phosphogluconolactonase
MRFLLVLLLISTFFACKNNEKPVKPALAPDEQVVFVGTYTEKLSYVDGKASGIYTCIFDDVSGLFTVIDSVGGLANPSFLTISPDKKYLFAVGENGGTAARPFGSVASFSIGERGKLTKINEVSAYGVASCHISTDKSGKFAFIANYVSGDVLSYGINADGSLTDSICRLKHPGNAPNAHMILPAPDGSIWSVDKGSDAIFGYDLDAKGRLKPKFTMPTSIGCGPRHLDFHPTIKGRFAVVNELSCSIWIGQMDEKTGDITILDTISTLLAGLPVNSTCADIHWHPNGRRIYASNRNGFDSIAGFEVEAATGKISLLDIVSSHGKIPRSFLVTPDGKWMLVANQNSSNVVVFKVDEADGKINPFGEYRVFTPVCLKLWK